MEGLPNSFGIFIVSAVCQIYIYIDRCAAILFGRKNKAMRSSQCLTCKLVYVAKLDNLLFILLREPALKVAHIHTLWTA